MLDKIQRLRFWCQKVLPLVYDESLSYYEFLCKVANILNEVIDHENDLSDAFIDLEQYVDENVKDLETKITNVIQQMIDDGAFDEILQELVMYDQIPNYDTTSGSAGVSQLISRGDHTHPLNPEVLNLLYRFPLASVEDLSTIAGTQLMLVSYDTTTLNIPTEGRKGFCLHYASSANYAVQLAMGVGDSNVYTRKKSGGNWSEWSEVSADLTAIEDKINAISNYTNAKIKKWNVNTNGKIIFMGNSYGKYDTQNWSKWPELVAQYFDLGTEGTNWWNIAQPSHCLAEGIFLNDLTAWVTNHSSEVNNIGAVILVAGINDSRGQITGESSPRYQQVPSRLTELANYIKLNLPNATMYCGYVGWIDQVTRPSDDRTANYRMSVCKSYTESVKDGWKYLNGIENIFHNKNYMADGVHPNETGALKLANGIANAIIQGGCTVIESANTTPTTTGTVASNSQVRERQQNETIYTLLNAIDFTFTDQVTFTRNQIVIIGNVLLKLSNFIDFGNQMFTVRDTSNNTIPILGRLYIEANTGNIVMQPKDFFNGENSIAVNRVVSFILTDTHIAIND